MIKQSYEAAKVKGTGKVLLTGVGDSDDDSATVLVVHDASVKTTPGQHRPPLPLDRRPGEGRRQVARRRLQPGELRGDDDDYHPRTRPGTTCSASPATPAPTRSRPPGATPPTSSSRAPAPASSGCSTRRPTCCSTRSAARRTTRRWTPPTRPSTAPTRRPPPPAPADAGRRPPATPKPTRRPSADAARTASDRAGAPAGRARRSWPLAVLAVLTVVALVLAVVFGLQVRKDAQVADARDEAPAAAERAAKAMLRPTTTGTCRPTGRAAKATSPTSTARST